MKRIKSFSILLSVIILGMIIGYVAGTAAWTHPFQLAVVGGIIAAGSGLMILGLRKTNNRPQSWQMPSLKRDADLLPQPITSLFLFNTLHNIAALILFDAQKAGETVENLANLIRTTTDLRRKQQTFLGEEFKAIELYLEVERARLGERLIINKEFSKSCLEIPFPSLALYPIVHNCVRFGVEMQMHPVTILVSCHKQNKDIIIEVADSVESEEAEAIEAQERMLAFRTLQRQLTGFFGQSVKCSRKPISVQGEQVTITIPLKDAMVPRFASQHTEAN
jgi:LytS/YehU family sensor histidine kinase